MRMSKMNCESHHYSQVSRLQAGFLDASWRIMKFYLDILKLLAGVNLASKSMEAIESAM